VEHEDELTAIRKSVAKLKPNGGVWVVYPKGVKTVRESRYSTPDVQPV